MSHSGEGESFTPKRSTRKKRPSLKALASGYTTKSSASRQRQETSSSDDSDEERPSQSERKKPTVLHDNDLVQGSSIFKFQSRQTRGGFSKKVTEVCGQSNIAKTPHAVRNKLKTQIAAKIMEDNSTESDNEYEPSEKSDDDDDDESLSNSSATSSDSISTTKPPESSVNRPLENAKKQRANTASNHHQYFVKTDEYFSNHSTKSIQTSNHTLDKLATPRLPQDELQKLLVSMKLSKAHEISVNDLSTLNQSYFNKWLYLLHENFSILLYGLGSKRHILNRFHHECLQTSPVVVVNGFFPSLTIKDVLDAILSELLEFKESSIANVYESCHLIERTLDTYTDTILYLIVHNIDMIRTSKAQTVFARLASIKNVCLIASIDHINGPLLWDHSKLSKFNFSWWDVTSFQSYKDETSFESSMLVQRSGTLALSSLRNVFLSLTKNSKGIYIVVVKHQLEHGKNKYYQGIAFKDLYWSCREAFLVSSDLALRAQLTEFIDHKMIKSKRSVDGTENLTIPLPNGLLQQFLDEYSS